MKGLISVCLLITLFHSWSISNLYNDYLIKTLTAENTGIQTNQEILPKIQYLKLVEEGEQENISKTIEQIKNSENPVIKDIQLTSQPSSSSSNDLYYQGIWGLGGRQGNYGRYSIPSLRISTPLNTGGYTQDWVDKNHSAAIECYRNAPESLYDHYNQDNTYAIVKAIPGKTVLYIRHGNQVLKYVCSKVLRWIPKNWGTGSVIDGKLAQLHSEWGDICFQTCEGRHKYNAFVYFIKQ